MSTGLATIDRELQRDLDHRLHDPHEAASPAKAAASDARADVAGILEAVQFTASSISAMAGRIKELEAHTQAFEVSNRQLEAHNQSLSTELDDVARQQDALATSLDAEHDRMLRLEDFAAHHISRATGLERELVAAQSDFDEIAQVVRSLLGSLPEKRRL